MRSCQICGESDHKLIFSVYDGQDMNLYECDACGHHYVDSAKLSQAWFDNFYLHNYHADDIDYSGDRYLNLADYVGQHAKEVLDVGGTSGNLKEFFKDFPYRAVGPADEITKSECIVLSHTLEHVYDVDTLMKRIVKALPRDGLLVIEVPVHIVYVSPKKYDYHWQHINKFRPLDLMELLMAHGFSIVEFCKLPNYREYQCWRIAGRLW